MKLVNEFRVRVPAEKAWAVLTDLEKIAPCMPGAQLTGVEGDEYHGTVKIKVGPVAAQYKGTATWKEKDESSYRAVILATGRDTRGQGNANATITAYLTPEADGTKVTVDTDLAITGKVAQFGRSLLGDVSAKIMNQFADCLASTVLAPEPIPASQATPPAAQPASPSTAPAAASASETAPATPAPAFRPITQQAGPEPEPVNGIALVAGPVLQRLAPVAAGIALALLALRLLRRRKAEPSGGADLAGLLGGGTLRGPVLIVLAGQHGGGLARSLEDALVARTPTDVP